MTRDQALKTIEKALWSMQRSREINPFNGKLQVIQPCAMFYLKQYQTSELLHAVKCLSTHWDQSAILVNTKIFGDRKD